MSTSSSLAALYNNASSSTLTTSTTTSAADLDQEFLQMLMTELQNEDPTNPVDSTTMLAQQAQFESLAQMQDLNTNLTTLAAMQSTSQAVGLIGQTVTGSDTGGATVTGLITGVKFVSGTAELQLTIGSGSSATTDTMTLADVTSIS